MDGLKINGNVAYTTYGVMMSDGFLDALFAPAGLKDFLTFESRVLDGTKYMLTDSNGNSMAKKKERDLTLKFRILADENQTLSAAQSQLQTRYAAFMAVLNAGAVNIQVPTVSSDYFRLVYTGQSISFNYSPQRTSCEVGAKFVEPDPTNRTAPTS